MKTKNIAIARFGVEKITSIELSKLGIEVGEISNGRVEFVGDSYDIAKANIHLRTAERVLMVLKEFSAFSFDELFDNIEKIDWGDILPEDAYIQINAKSVKSQVYSTKDIQSISKKAIIQKMKEKYKKEWFSEDGEKYRIDVSFLKDNVTISLDTTGDGLHKRGYRKLVGEAPLSETLASTLILLSKWKNKNTLVDPFCGTGTIPIEAALIGINCPPGLNRNFISEKYTNLIGKKVYEDVKNKARDLIDYDADMKIIGTDISQETLELARYHAKLAGVEENIHFQQMDVSEIQYSERNGYFITNPPYGERMMNDKDLIDLYKKMQDTFNRFETWSKYVITAYPDFEKVMGKKAKKRRKLYNGMIACQFYQYYGNDKKL